MKIPYVEDDIYIEYRKKFFDMEIKEKLWGFCMALERLKIATF